MGIEYGFFNSIDNDRTYNADDMSNYFEGLVSDGVYAAVGDACVVKTLGALTLSVGTGRAIINNKWVKIDNIQPVRITPHTSLNRYDAICLQLDNNARKISIVVIEGTPSTTPQIPTITNNSKIKHLVLAHVYVKANADRIIQSDITDRRPYKIYCGWVTGLIKQVDTSELFLQFQTACEEKQKEIQEWQTAQANEFENWKSIQMQQFSKWQERQTLTLEGRANALEIWLSEQKQSFETWYNNLKETLTVNVNPATSRIYTVETDEGGQAELPFTYNDSQAVHVYINGLIAVEGEDYTIENGKIQLNNTMFDSGADVVTFVVFKAGVVTGGSGGIVEEEISVSDIKKMVSEIDGLKDETERE